MTKVRKSLALAAAAGVAVSMAVVAAPAQAAEQSIDGVTLTWGFNAESGAAGFAPGTCNFLSAGVAGNSGSSRVWTKADGFYKASEGNVSIIKDGPNGGTMTPDWDTKCQTGDGSAVTTGTGANQKVSNNKVVLSNGTGSVDPETGEATVSWTGSFTSVFYSGMTYWSATNPVLTVAEDGTATLKATASGYQADMNDTSKWIEIPGEEITLANLKGVELTEAGFNSTPEYLEVAAPSSVAQQKPAGIWGSFPADFVEFQGKTGTQSYWFSSGGAADARKPTTELNVAWVADFTVPVDPELPETPQVAESEDVTLDVNVPTKPVEPEEKEFKWNIAGNSLSLGTAAQQSIGFVASGTLPEITVSDNRENSKGWTVTGKTTDFKDGANTFGGNGLGWAPSGTTTGTGVTLGAYVVPGSTNGLSATSTMASATGASTAKLNTGVHLLAPTDAPAGDYTSTLTVTAIQK
ncbi:hypothetical protein [Glutamicibacter sp. NPDC087344]|uniref:hypothetical protein n=1 Tax=Glutamicibacter sp. NPDC087344 TaxID=3363994 RepID=UPI0038247EE1